MEKTKVVKLREIIRIFVLSFQRIIFTKLYQMDISSSARVSFRTYLDKTHQKGIHIGDESYIASGAMILTHDYTKDLKTNTIIGQKCFIGANSIIMPGIIIGDSVIVGAGSIVTKNIPSGSIVVGNPARIIKNGIKTKKYGVIVR
jgi:acetyltransferase-like isoleucine patch superfamily enzyme